jgi:hypothetical protein
MHHWEYENIPPGQPMQPNSEAYSPNLPDTGAKKHSWNALCLSRAGWSCLPWMTLLAPAHSFMVPSYGRETVIDNAHPPTARPAHLPGSGLKDKNPVFPQEKMRLGSAWHNFLSSTIGGKPVASTP